VRRDLPFLFLYIYLPSSFLLIFCFSLLGTPFCIRSWLWHLDSHLPCCISLERPKPGPHDYAGLWRMQKLFTCRWVQSNYGVGHGLALFEKLCRRPYTHHRVMFLVLAWRIALAECKITIEDSKLKQVSLQISLRTEALKYAGYN
jgi:hypothetical protein